MTRLEIIAPILALAALAACGGGGGGTGTVSLSVTDAPLGHDLVRAARIRVDRVTAHASGVAEGEDGGWLTLYDGAPRELDLVDLAGGVTASLVDGRSLPAGKYRQLRLRIASAELELVNDALYTTEAGTLQPTSTDDSGLKLFLDPPLVLQDGAARSLLLDFDLGRSFTPVPADDPLAATSYLLHPVVHVANLSGGGELRGAVRDAGDAPVAGATVYLLAEGESAPEDALRSTATLADGTWALLAVDPGTYDVRAVKGDLTGEELGLVVTAGGVTLSAIVVQ